MRLRLCTPGIRWIPPSNRFVLSCFIDSSVPNPFLSEDALGRLAVFRNIVVLFPGGIYVRSFDFRRIFSLIVLRRSFFSSFLNGYRLRSGVHSTAGNFITPLLADTIFWRCRLLQPKGCFPVRYKNYRRFYYNPCSV